MDEGTDNIIVVKRLNGIIQASIALIVIAVPFDHTNSITSISIVIALLAWLTKKWLMSNWKITISPLHLPLLALFIAILLSTFTSLNLFLTINKIRGEFLTYTMLYMLIIDNFNSREDIWRLVRVFLLGNLIILVYFTFSFTMQGVNFDAWLQYLANSYLSRGTPHTSTYFLFWYLIIYTGFYYIKSFWKWSVLFYLCIFLANAFFLLLCNQRAAIVGSCSAMIAHFLLFKANRKKAAVGCLVIPILVGIFVVVTPLREALIHENWNLILKRDFSPTHVDRDTTQLRYQVYKFWTGYLKEHPFEGVGYGRNNMKSVYVTHGHNAFLNIAVQTGIQGLVALLAIIAVQLRCLYKGSRWAKRDLDQFILTGTAIYIIGFWIRNQFDDTFRHGTAIWYWIVAGLSMALYMIIEKERNHSTTSGGPDDV